MGEIIFKVIDNSNLRNGMPENNDCTVRALSSALNAPYKEIHGILKTKGGRINGEGVIFKHFMRKHKSFLQEKYGVELRETNRFKTLHQIVSGDPQGTYVVSVDKHITTIRRGYIVDTGRVKDVEVKTVWKVLNL